MNRSCEVCNNKESNHIYVQKFISVGSRNLITHKIVHCLDCGFIFVSNITQQKKLDVYYKNNNKYLYANRDIVSPELKAFHKDFFDFINHHLVSNHTDKNYKDIYILDIGCGNGNLLNVFRNNHYKKILGLDPSRECALFAKNNFNIDITTSTIDNYKINRKFDVVIMASVLEHIAGLNKSLNKITRLLSKNGKLVVLVPDLSKFGKIMKEPFVEFSLEHINFFTIRSLSNLLGKYGYTLVKSKSLRAEYFGSYALMTIWQKTGVITSIQKDDKGLLYLQKYILLSQKKLKKAEIIINELVITQEPIIVWGTGSLTSRLLGTTKFKEMNIVEFIDKNTSLQGRRLVGKMIEPPQMIRGKKLTIFISSFIYGNDIKVSLIKDYNYKGKIILI